MPLFFAVPRKRVFLSPPSPAFVIANGFQRKRSARKTAVWKQELYEYKMRIEEGKIKASFRERQWNLSRREYAAGK